MDTKTVNLPSGKTAEIRNYTTRKDDEKAEEILYIGVNSSTDSTGKGKVSFPIANVMASEHVYVRRLVLSLDGDSTNIAEKLGELRSSDYEALKEAVDEVVEINSPKAKAGKKVYKPATSEN